EGLTGERKCLRRSPVFVEVTDADHSEPGQGGVRGDEGEIEVAAVRAEYASRFVEVGGDASGREKLGFGDPSAGIIRGSSNLLAPGAETNGCGQQSDNTEHAAGTAGQRRTPSIRHAQGQIVGPLDGSERKTSPFLSLSPATEKPQGYASGL